MSNNQSNLIYLDHAATTPLDPEVLKAMQPVFLDSYANPSSTHAMGHAARRLIDDARDVFADVLGCRASEVLFTNGGTESVNLAVLGAARAAGNTGHIVTTAIEHAAVLDSCAALEQQGVTVTYVAPQPNGIVDVQAVVNALQEDTFLVSVMLANNEIGTVQPIAQIAEAVQTYAAEQNTKVLIHTDACQATGALSLNVEELGVDLLTLNAGKIYGPKGMGALYVRKGVELQPVLFGGGQERKLRPGTENVPGIIGFAKALELAEARRNSGAGEQLAVLRNTLMNGILEAVPGTQLNGDHEQRLPNNANILINDVDGDALLFALDQAGLQVSLGSACAAGSVEPSHVLQAIGLSKEDARRSIRFSLGKDTTAEQIAEVIERVPPIVERLRSL